MKSFQMKALAVAVLGLFAGSVIAACPTDPAAPNGPWASKSSLQGSIAITTPGLNGTSCALQVSLNSGASTIAKAFVTDTTPADEMRYRARFYIDTTELVGMNNALKQVPIFTATAQNSPAGVASDEVQAVLVGGTPISVRILAADSAQGSHFLATTVPLAVSNGVNRIEFDLTTAAAGSLRYWVSAGNVATTDGSPTGTLNVNNAAWSGVTQASMGLFAASGQYRSSVPNTQHLYLDEFDSRRQTFIGQ